MYLFIYNILNIKKRKCAKKFNISIVVMYDHLTIYLLNNI